MKRQLLKYVITTCVTLFSKKKNYFPNNLIKRKSIDHESRNVRKTRLVRHPLTRYIIKIRKESLA